MSGWRVHGIWWWLLLPLFFQIYHYKPETGPLYFLAKAWPALLAPLILYAVTSLRLPDGPLYILAVAYTIFLSPFLSLLYLPNGLVDAALSTVKAWPLTFYFSAAALLVLLRPSEETLARAAVGCGVATFLVMLTLWMVVPEEAYRPTPFGANMFSWDEGRGNYIRMPMMLAELTLFWLGQRLVREWRLWQFLLLAGAILAMVTIYKARLPIGVTVIILTWILLARLPGNWRWGLGAMAMVPVLGLIMILGPDVPELLARTFDESLFIRLRSVGIAWDWMSGDPVKLMLGSGSISSFSSITMADFLGSADFFLADIGWLGVVMEYGLVGTALIAMLHLRALTTARTVCDDDPFRCALVNYVVFELMCSAVYSVMYAPGPVVTVAAIAYWLRARDAAGLAREQPGWPAAPATAPIEAPSWARGQVPVPQEFSRPG
ncbi:hypothetical protein ACVFYP_05390 [Roseomonas sp. F4]